VPHEEFEAEHKRSNTKQVNPPRSLYDIPNSAVRWELAGGRREA
jgi:hypothetical protein